MLFSTLKYIVIVINFKCITFYSDVKYNKFNFWVMFLNHLSGTF